MPRTRTWTRIAAKSLDAAVYGRTVYAVRHRGGALLLHRKNTSRNSRDYHNCGMWLVVIGRDVIRAKPYVNAKEIRRPPTRWAAGVLRRHASGVYVAEWAEQAALDAEREAACGRACSRCAAPSPPPSDGPLSGCADPYCPRLPWPPWDDGTLTGTALDVFPRRCPDQLIWHAKGADELPRSLYPMAKRCRTLAGQLRGARRHQRRRADRRRRQRQKHLAAAASSA